MRHIFGGEFDHVSAALFESQQHFHIFMMAGFVVVATVGQTFLQQQQHPWKKGFQTHLNRTKSLILSLYNQWRSKDVEWVLHLFQPARESVVQTVEEVLYAEHNSFTFKWKCINWCSKGAHLFFGVKSCPDTFCGGVCKRCEGPISSWAPPSGRTGTRWWNPSEKKIMIINSAMY